MAPRYEIRVKDLSGAVVAILTDWKTLRYTKRINDLGSYTLTVASDSQLVPNIVLDGQIEIYRQDLAPTNASSASFPYNFPFYFAVDDGSAPIQLYKDFEGFHRTMVMETTERNEDLFSSIGVTYLDLIRRRVIGYPANSAQATQTGPGETVIKSMVTQNAGPGATAPPRLYVGTTTGLTVEATGGAGTTWTGDRSYRNLLDVIKEIALATGINFDAVGTGPATFEFRAKAYPWGADRTITGLNMATGRNAAGNTPVIFALDFGNMQTPSYSLNRQNEGNAIIVLGQGQDANRQTVESLNVTAIGDSTWNRQEAVRNANQEDTVAGLNSVGEQALIDLKAMETFSFQAMQIPALLYGRDYFVGDSITAKYKTVQKNLQIIGVTVSIQEGVESIQIEVKNVPF